MVILDATLPPTLDLPCLPSETRPSGYWRPDLSDSGPMTTPMSDPDRTESDTRPCHTTKTSSCARAVAGKALSLRSLTFRPFRTRFYKGILKFVAVSGKWFHITPSRSSVLYMVLSLLLNDFLLRRLPTQTRKCGNMIRICCGIQTSFPTLFTSPTSTDWYS